jgi:4-aminobutyrate aminotransferase/(S)-3-amino-2-methylpropionate transaminase
VIKRLTDIPGPRSRALLERRQRAVPRGPFNAAPVFVRSARGAIVEDVDGNTYVDFAGGLGCLNVGACADEIVEAVREQAGEFTHTCFHVAMHEPYVELAERLNKLTPGDFPKKTFFANSGAEAVENAVKIARSFTGRPAVLAFEDAFHGRTLLAMSLTSKVKPYKFGFGPFAPEVYRLPYAYCYRCPFGVEHPECEARCARPAIDDFFKRHVAAESVAAIIVEPVLGEGGFVVPPREFLSGIQETCRAHGILLIADEIQTGFGRTGKFFAIEHSRVEPDLITVAKSLAAGFPLSGVVGRADVMDAPDPGGLGGTYAGNPIACAAGLAVMDIMRDEKLPERAARIGSVVEERMQSWAGDKELIGDIRAVGAMVGMELVRSRKTKEPADKETVALLKSAREKGLIILRCGVHHNVVRTLMPLTIPDEQLEEGLDILGAALGA